MLFNGYLQVLHFYNIYIRTQKHCRTRRAWAACGLIELRATFYLVLNTCIATQNGEVEKIKRKMCCEVTCKTTHKIYFEQNCFTITQKLLVIERTAENMTNESMHVD